MWMKKCLKGKGKRWRGKKTHLIFILYHNLIYSNSHATGTVEGGKEFQDSSKN